MRWAGLVIFGAALALAATAGAGAPDAPSVKDPLPFDHPTHTDAFRRAGVTCVDCHPIGLRVFTDQGYRAPGVDPHPPTSACHGCHRGEFAGAPRTAGNECMACHADREELKPPSHGLGWVDAHAADARGRGAECSACHDTATCVECHEARGALADDPHPPGFRTTHGIEARIDPMSCSTCHSGEKCAACHATGALPW